MPKQPHDQKVVIVTAASRGMGKAIAERLNAAGYTLSLFSRSDDLVPIATNLNALATTGSVTNGEDLNNLVERTLATYGRIDAVVNNTGHPPKGDLLDIPDQDWHAGLDLMLLNTIRLARLTVPRMIEARAGAFVNISAFGAVEPSAGFPVSSVIRTALRAFTRLFAERYAASNIRMNSVLPGFIDSYDVEPEILNNIPAGRRGTVDEIAATTEFLLSDDAAYINGQSLLVDGGLVRTL